jgi:hypothetical protein
MRTNPVAALSLAVLAGIAGCPSPASSDEGVRGNPQTCSALIVTTDESENSKPVNRKAFRASRILDIRVRTVMPAGVVFGADDVVTFRFTTPKGNLYQTIEVPVASSVKQGERQRYRPGYPFPLEVQQPKSVTLNGLSAQSIEARLPVGGTAIMDSGLYGTWTVEGFVGNGRPCSATFTLQP